MYEQQPWWEHYPAFVNALSRIGMILREGAVQYDVLVLHPQTTAWALFDTVHNEPLEALQDALENIVRTLDEKHILFHLGDELIMERHARVEGNKLLIGQQAYTTVILPPHEVLLDRTKQLLAEFEAGGGRITTADALPENRVVDSPDIVYTVRHFDGADVYYFVNLTEQTIDASIAVGNKQIDLFTGAELPFDGRCTFAPHDSILVLADGGARAPVVRRTQKALDLSGMWKIKQADLNALTLDRCDYYFDGVCVEENGYVLNIQNRACDLGRPVQIECVYRVELRHLPETLYLVCETPERFEILVNGRPVDKTDCGFYRDRAFRKLNIAPLVCKGVNTITLRTDFSQSAAVYENIAKSKQFESEKNKLCYDMEIEPLYLLGDFAVETDGGFEPLENDGVRYTGGFAIAAPVREAALAHLEQHGYPFFCGSITFEKEFQLEDTDYKLKLAQHGYNAVVAEVNGAAFPPMLWGSFEADLSGHLRKGANTIRLTVVNNLRNLLGPHHLESGEPLGVGPGSFFMEPCVWNQHLQQKDVNPNYCFVQFGLL